MHKSTGPNPSDMIVYQVLEEPITHGTFVSTKTLKQNTINIITGSTPGDKNVPQSLEELIAHGSFASSKTV